MEKQRYLETGEQSFFGDYLYGQIFVTIRKINILCILTEKPIMKSSCV